MTTRVDSFSEAKELSRLDDPAVKARCIELKRRSEIQDHLLQGLIVCLLASFIFLQRGYAGYGSRSGNYRPPNPSLIPWGTTMLGLSLALAVFLLGIRNYYLADPVERKLYHLFRFFWSQRRRIVFRPGEILGVTVEAERRSSKTGTYWLYRLIVLGNDGRKEPISNWERDGLEHWNERSGEVADCLSCESYPAPSESTASVERSGEKATIQFTPYAPKMWRSSTIIRLIVFVLVVLFALFLARHH